MHLIVLLFPSLYKLKLDNNKIDDINKLKGLIGSKIEKISVKGNPFTISNKDYIKQIFEMFHNIYSVDGFDKEGEIVNTTDEEDYKMEEEIDSEDNDEESNDLNEAEISSKIENEMDDNEDDDDDDIQNNISSKKRKIDF